MSTHGHTGGGIKRFLTAYYLYVFLFDFILCYAIYTAYFELRGLGYGQIGLLLAIWSGSALVLEIWSGALSDWLDRRWLLIAAPLIKCLTFVAWALADGNFWLYALGFVLWSLGQSFFSGTQEALLYERLEAEGKSEHFDKHFSWSTATETLAVALGVLFGGFVAARNMELSIWLSIVPLTFAAAIALWLVDVRRSKEEENDGHEEPGFLQNFSLALSELGKSHQLRFLLAYIALGLVLFEELEEFDLLFYTAVDLPVVLFGVVGACGLGLQALVSSHAYRVKPYPALAWILPLCAAAILVVAGMRGGVVDVVLVELSYLIAVPAAVQAEARFQQSLSGQSRATVTSMLYFLQNVSAIIIALAIGWLAQISGILNAYIWAGLLMVPVAVWVFTKQRGGASAF